MPTLTASVRVSGSANGSSTLGFKDFMASIITFASFISSFFLSWTFLSLAIFTEPRNSFLMIPLTIMADSIMSSALAAW